MSLGKRTRTLDDVKVWFRCSVCRGFLCSIPALKDHSNYEHNLAPQDVKLPENLPPGALEGKVFFEYLPYDWSGGGGGGGGGEDSESDDTLPLYDIRIRDVADLFELSDEDQEGECNRQEQRESIKASDDSGEGDGHNPIVSPPDSGMFDDDDDERVSGIQEDEEGQQHQTIIPTPIRSTDKESESGSSAPLPTGKKFSCPICNKSYKSQGALNFHSRKAHPIKNHQTTATVSISDDHPPPKTTDKSSSKPSKLILKFTRDAGTGTFFAATGVPSNGLPVEAQPPRKKRGPARFTRAPPSTIEVPQEDDDCAVPSPSPPAHHDSSPPVSEDSSDSDEGPRTRRTRALPLASESSSSSSSSSEKSDADVDSSSEGESSPTPPKRILRKRKNLPRRRLVDFASDSEISFITSSSVSKRSRRTDDATDDEDDSDEEEAVMTDKDTTSEDELSAPCLSDHREDDNGAKSPSPSDPEENGGKRMTEKVKSPEQVSTDYDDLFIPIAPKIKRKKKRKSKSKSSPKTTTTSLMGPPAPMPVLLPQSSTVCKQCNMECRDSNALIRHMKLLHKGSTLVCGFCQKRYRKKHHFNKHIMTHHQGQKDKEKV